MLNFVLLFCVCMCRVLHLILTHVVIGCIKMGYFIFVFNYLLEQLLLATCFGISFVNRKCPIVQITSVTVV